MKVGDDLEITGITTLPVPVKTTATGVEMFKKSMDVGQAGDNVGILLRGLKREDVLRGQVRAAQHVQHVPHVCLCVCLCLCVCVSMSRLHRLFPLQSTGAFRPCHDTLMHVPYVCDAGCCCEETH